MIEYTVRVYANVAKDWYLNGKLHREDGPAVEYADGNNDWYLNGKLHREDGPAVEGSEGYKAWYLHGKQHREDGPAIECSDGYKAWYLNDVWYTEQEHKEATKSKCKVEGKVVEIDGIKYELREVKKDVLW